MPDEEEPGTVAAADKAFSVRIAYDLDRGVLDGRRWGHTCEGSDWGLHVST